MDFNELLHVAKSKEIEAKSEASIKRYDTSLGPPKKNPKPNVQSKAIKQFLARKQAEEQQRLEEARQKREQLLAIRAQSTKNNKKAKIMASRTKDNDFSKIKLTDDEIEAKKKREAELLKMTLNNKVERMKARIEMEEKEKLLPRKRKRKSKINPEGADEVNEENVDLDEYNSQNDFECESKKSEHYRESPVESKDIKIGLKKRRPPPPPTATMSFYELLKVAATKQHEPVIIPKVTDDEKDKRPLTKKERKLFEEEENRKRRKLELSNKTPQSNMAKTNNAATKISSNFKAPQHANSSDALNKNQPHLKNSTYNNKNDESKRKEPVVVRVQKDTRMNEKSNSIQRKQTDMNNAHMINAQNASKNFNQISKSKDVNLKSCNSNAKVLVNQNRTEKCSNANAVIRKENNVYKSEKSLSKAPNGISTKAGLSFQKKDVSLNKSNEGNSKRVPQAGQVPGKTVGGKVSIDPELLTELKKQMREDFEKEIEARLLERLSKMSNKDSEHSNHNSNRFVEPQKKLVESNSSFRTNSATVKTSDGVKVPAKHISNQMPSKLKISSSEKTQVTSNKVSRPPQNTVSHTKDRPSSAKPDMSGRNIPPHKNLEKPRPQIEIQKKPAFHPNPYLQPPRRLLESQRPQKLPPKRRIESEDEDDEEEDMNDFIDDGKCEENLDYSKYIKEIFGYDRSKYIDDDDDDVMESSFAEQMKEEVRSAKIGYLEDLEDMKKEEEEMRRKKKKKKLK